MGGDDANEDDDDDIPRTFTCVGSFLQKEQRKVAAAAERKKIISMIPASFPHLSGERYKKGENPAWNLNPLVDLDLFTHTKSYTSQ